MADGEVSSCLVLILGLSRFSLLPGSSVSALTVLCVISAQTVLTPSVGKYTSKLTAAEHDSDLQSRLRPADNATSVKFAGTDSNRVY